MFHFAQKSRSEFSENEIVFYVISNDEEVENMKNIHKTIKVTSRSGHNLTDFECG